MTTKEEILEIIGQRPLTDKEQQLVEQWRESDRDFAEAVDFQEQFVGALHQKERQSLKSFLQSLEEEQTKPKSKIFNLSFLKWVAVAAAILGFIGIWQVTYTPKIPELYAANFRPYPNVMAPVTRNGNSAPDMELQKAFSAYDNGDYGNAAVAFNQIALKTGEPYAYFYEAISKMGMGKTKEALGIFMNKPWPIQPFDMKNATEWYISLCLLAEGNKEEAIQKLVQISINPESTYANQAGRLLKELDR